MALSQDAVKSMLDAMKIISSAEMKNISYDTTIVCTIVDNSHAEKESYYTVSPDDGVKFKAYVMSTEDTTKYKVNDQVYVKIPQGDYSRQKVIEGYYVAESAEIPATYISPLNGFLDMKSLSAADNTDAQFTDADKALIANKSKEIAIWHWSIDPLGSNADDLQMSGLYDTLAIAGDFKCLLDKYRMYSGSYGLRLELVVRLHATSDLHTLYSVKLDSSEMFGNPYAFSLYSTQAKAFDISSIGIIDGMTLYFYQDDNFNYYDAKGNVVRLSYEAEEALGIEPSPNILLENVYVALGSNLVRVADNSLKIYSLQDNAFKLTDANDSTNRKDISFVWYNKNEKNEYIGFSDGIVQIDDTTQKIIPYDEIDYLKRSAANSRLQAQMGKAIPTDKNGLEMSANVSDAESLINNIISLVQVNLVNTLGDLWQRTQSMNQIKKNPEDETKWINATQYLNDNLKAKAKAYGQEFETESKALIKWYKEALAAAAAIQTHQSKGTSPTEEEKPFTVPDQLFYNTEEGSLGLINKWEAFVPYFYNGNFYLNDLKDAIANRYNGFQSVYDTYSIKLQKIFDSIQEKFDKLTELLKDKEKLVSSTNIIDTGEEVPEGESTDTFPYQYNINVIIEEFKPASFSGDDNRYCTYWYVYDEAATGDEILEPGWRRLLPGEVIKSGLASTFEMPQNLGLPSEYTDEGEDLYLVAQAKPEESFLTVFLNPEKKEEKFKLVLFYNHEKFVSDEIVFTNADPVVDTTTLDVNGSIKIAHGNRSNENYQTFYNSTNTLINEADASFGRGLSVSYDGVLGDNDSLIDAQVFWYVPKNSSMLSADINRLTSTYKFSTDYRRRAEVIADTTIRMGPGTDYSQIIESTTKDEQGNDIHTYLGYKINDSVEVYTKDGEYYSLTLEGKKGLNGRWIHESAIKIVDNGEDYMEGFACFYKTIGSVDKKNENGEVIKDKDDKVIKVVNPDDLTFEYKIKNYYVPTALNNTIFCIVKKAEYKFETSISMTFGTQGTSGTDYTLLVQPSTSQRAVQGTKALPLSIQLFNYNNEEVPITAKTIAEQNQASLNIKWAGPSVYLSAISNEKENLEINSLEVDLNKELKSITDYCGIIQVGTTVTDGKYHKTTNEVDNEGNKKTRTIELAVKYPIPYSPHNYYIEGATTIIYDSNGGNPVYYKEPYKLYDGETNALKENITWSVWCYMQKNAVALNEDAVAPLYKFNINEIQDLTAEPKEIPADIQQAVEFYRGYMPRLDDENRLIPANMYISEVYLDDDDKEKKGHVNAYPVVHAYSGEDLLWAQPIVIDQNRYPNAVVNAWDGEFEINEKNGTIMSSMVGAGYKNSDNTYSGVLMGNISGGEQLATGNKTDVGLYGFHHGEQSFGLNIDGTAFFGKSGRGRILIDGNDGTIESASYSQGLDSGMRIDLDDGFIDMRGVAKIGTPDSSILSNARLGYMTLGSAEMGLSPSSTVMTEEEFNNIPDDDPLFGKEVYDSYDAYRYAVGDLSAAEWEKEKDKYEIQHNSYLEYLEASLSVVKSYKQSRVHIDVQSPYFTIHSSNQAQRDKHIIHIANDEYYLESDNYIEAKYSLIDGISIDENGYLYKKEVLIDTNGNIIFDINNDIVYKFIYVDEDGNELSSIINYINIDGNEVNEIIGADKVLGQGQGTKINLQTGKFDAYNLLLTSKNIYLDSTTNANPFFVVRDDDGCNLIYAGKDNYYLKSHGFSDDNFTGTKIDLVSGSIDAYNFKIKGVNNSSRYRGSFIELTSEPSLKTHLLEYPEMSDDAYVEYTEDAWTANGQAEVTGYATYAEYKAVLGVLYNENLKCWDEYKKQYPNNYATYSEYKIANPNALIYNIFNGPSISLDLLSLNEKEFVLHSRNWNGDTTITETQRVQIWLANLNGAGLNVRIGPSTSYSKTKKRSAVSSGDQVQIYGYYNTRGQIVELPYYNKNGYIANYEQTHYLNENGEKIGLLTDIIVPEGAIKCTYEEFIQYIEIVKTKLNNECQWLSLSQYNSIGDAETSLWSSYYLSNVCYWTINYDVKIESEISDKQGMEISLNKGSIIMYNGAVGQGDFIIDTTHPTYPLQIGNIINENDGLRRFRIGWDGSMMAKGDGNNYWSIGADGIVHCVGAQMVDLTVEDLRIKNELYFYGASNNEEADADEEGGDSAVSGFYNPTYFRFDTLGFPADGESFSGIIDTIYAHTHSYSASANGNYQGVSGHSNSIPVYSTSAGGADTVVGYIRPGDININITLYPTNVDVHRVVPGTITLSGRALAKGINIDTSKKAYAATLQTGATPSGGGGTSIDIGGGIKNQFTVVAVSGV